MMIGAGLLLGLAALRLGAQTLQPSPSSLRTTAAKVVVGNATVAPLTATEADTSNWRRALCIAHQDRDTFVTLLRNAITDPALYGPWTRSTATDGVACGGDSVPMATVIRLAVMTKEPDQLFASLQGLTAPIALIAALKADSLRILVDSALTVNSSPGEITVYAEGNIKSASTDSAKNGANGALGIRYRKGRWAWTASINVASTSDTMTSGFSQLILAPATGKFLSAGLFDVAVYPTRLHNLHFHSYLTASQSTWKNVARGADGAVVLGSDSTINATVVGVGALAAFDFLSDTVGGSHVGLSAEFGLSTRFIVGDAGNVLDSAFRVRPAVLGTNSRWFGGLEGGLQLTFGNVVAALQVYAYRNPSSGQVRGVTDVQLVGGFSVQAPIIDKIIR